MQFGPYVLGEVLGRGGTATVYRATDTRSGKDVALKLLHPEVSAKPRVRRRFETEIQTLTRLRHPNAIRVYDAGSGEGQLWLALELIEGESLQARLGRETTLSVPEAVRVGTSVAEALAHAHDHGVLHRDVKPDNVLLAADGRVVLTDFGLALDQEQEGGLSRLTRDGMFMGTPGFWAPEQAKGRLADVGPATDIYGLGATLYTCLTGAPPIQGDHLVAFLRTGAFEAVASVGSKRPETPPWLSAVCSRCLEADPKQRYADGRALLDALGVGSAHPTRLGRRARVGLALTVAGVAVVMAAAAALRPPAASSPSTSQPPGPPVPSLARVHAELTSALIRGRLNREAEATGSVTLQTAPLWPAAWAARAFARARLGDQAGARTDAARALELDPTCALAYAARAESAIVHHDAGAAAPDRDLALLHGPALPWAHAVDGGVLRLEGLAAEAEAAYRRALALDPDLPQAHSELGFHFSGLSRHAEALAEYQRCSELTPYVAEDWRNSGRSLLSLGRPDEASRDLDRALELEPDHPIALYHRGAIAYTQGRNAAATRDFERVLEFEPENVNALTYLGLVAFRENRFVDALRSHDHALELDPESKSAHVNRGVTLRAMGRFPEAVASYSRALELDPYNAQTYGARAQLYIHMQEFRLALDDAGRALGLEPDSMVGVVARSLASAELGDYPQAIRDMERFLASDVEGNASERVEFARMLRAWRARIRRK